MSHFGSSAKEYPTGDPLDGFGAISVDVIAAGDGTSTSLEQKAPAVLYDEHGNPLDFLFWDTGRRITNKLRVRWTFSHTDKWTEWHAVAWYGPRGPGEPKPLVGMNGYWVGIGPLTATPMDAPNSTWVNAPGGTPVAYPWAGDDHVLRTEWGAASIHGKQHLQAGISDPQLDFSSWIQLIRGGDDTGFFSESDDDIDSTSSGSGVTGIPASGTIVYDAAQGSGPTLLAGYVAPAKSKIDIHWIDGLREAIAGLIGKPIDKGDQSPEDIIRLKLISESIDMVRGERPTSVDAFEALTAAAPRMTPQELKRTIISTQTTLRRGAAAVKTLEALAAKQRAATVKRSAAPKRAVKAKKPAK